MSEKIITLEAVYDNSDLMTDYFDHDSGLFEWFVTDMTGAKITEAKLRSALSKLPEWLRTFNWILQKGERYSMSDHPYHQLRADTNTGLTFLKNPQIEERKAVRFILSVSHKDIFLMNHKLETSIPQTLDEIHSELSSIEDKRRLRISPLTVSLGASIDYGKGICGNL
jgi:hypothetical protein